jgi:hypothetical protein
MASSLYDGILLPQGGVYPGAGPDVVFPSGSPPSVPAGVSRVTGEGLNVYSRPTYSVDNYGNPILEQQKANAVAQALGVGGGGRGIAGARGDVAAALSGIPTANGTLVAGKSQDRLTPNAFGYGENGMTGWTPQTTANPTTALAAIDAAAGVGLPRRRPNIEANPGTLVPIQQPDTGLLGVKMSPGMNRNIAARAALGGIPGVMQRAPVGRQPVNNITVRGGNKTQQALAQVAASAPRVNASNYAPVPQYQSSGVANPAYRDYSGVNTSSGGGIAPSSSSGTFTDSLGGTYRDRNL